MNAVELREIVKTYRATRALDQLSLEVRAGELFGLVGVNGAGKTTTLSTIMGFIRASSGAVQVLGLNPWKDAPALHARIAWLPGDVRLPDAQTALEWLTYQAKVLKLELTRVQALALEWDVPLDRPMRTLSKGNRQKVALLRLLASNAELLILDEPTSGLDPVAQERLMAALRERAKAGATVLFSSHNLTEVQALCDRIAVIEAGRVVREGSVSALIGQTQTLSVWSQLEVDPKLFHNWKLERMTANHVVLEGAKLLEDALPKLVPFGIERLEFGGMGLERLLAQVHQTGSTRGNGGRT